MVVKVSVIVTTFNRENLLKETLDSILNQTFRDFELFVIDNFSIDDTENVVKSYNDDRIKYFKNQNNGIVAVNRNFAISKSKGEFISFCDDDDLWLHQKLKRQVDEFEKDEKLGIVCTNGFTFYDSKKEKKIGTSLSRYYTFNELFSDNIITFCSVMIRKKVLDKVGLFDENKEIFTGEDYELWLRIAHKYKVKYIGTPLIKYRVHEGALQNEYGIKGKSLTVDRAIYEKLFKGKIIDDKTYQKSLLKLNYQRLTIDLICNNNTINLNKIIQTQMGAHEKCRLILVYFLFVTGILNILRNIDINRDLLHIW